MLEKLEELKQEKQVIENIIRLRRIRHAEKMEELKVDYTDKTWQNTGSLIMTDEYIKELDENFEKGLSEKFDKPMKIVNLKLEIANKEKQIETQRRLIARKKERIEQAENVINHEIIRQYYSKEGLSEQPIDRSHIEILKKQLEKLIRRANTLEKQKDELYANLEALEPTKKEQVEQPEQIETAQQPVAPKVEPAQQPVQEEATSQETRSEGFVFFNEIEVPEVPEEEIAVEAPEVETQEAQSEGFVFFNEIEVPEVPEEEIAVEAPEVETQEAQSEGFVFFNEIEVPEVPEEEETIEIPEIEVPKAKAQGAIKDEATDSEFKKISISINDEDSNILTTITRKKPDEKYNTKYKSTTKLSDQEGLGELRKRVAKGEDRYIVREIVKGYNNGYLTREEAKEQISLYAKLLEGQNQEEKEEIKKQFQIFYDLRGLRKAGLTREQRLEIEENARTADKLGIAIVDVPAFTRIKWFIKDIPSNAKNLWGRIKNALPLGKKAEALPEKSSESKEKTPVVEKIEVNVEEAVKSTEQIEVSAEQEQEEVK